MSERKRAWLTAIPKRWRLGAIGDLAIVNQSSLPDNESPEREIEYFDISAASDTTPVPVRMRFKDAPSRARRVAQQGDVIYSCVRPLLRRVFFANGGQNAVYSTGYAILHPKTGNDARFIKHTLISSHVEKEVYARLTGSGYPAITTADLSKIPVLIPPQSEQRQIAEILSTWDQALELLSTQINRKRGLFASLRESLVHGACRIGRRNTPWPIIALGSFLTLQNERLGNGAELEVYSVTRDGLVPQEQHFNRRIANSDLSRHIIVRPGDFALSGLNFWLGSVDVSILDEPVCISPDYKVFKVDNTVDARYLRHVVRTHRFTTLLKAAAVERASIVRKNFDRETFLGSELHLPLPDEQGEIAGVLDDAEREIRALEAEQAALTKQRDALASELLTGRTRVAAMEATP